MALEDFIKDFAPELQEKIRACESVEELAALAKETKAPLSDEALEGVAGGVEDEKTVVGDVPPCPQCGSTNVMLIDFPDKCWWHCYDCGYEWDFSS